MIHTFIFNFLGKKVRMFNEGQMGIVIEKEPHIVCVYGTDENFHILCAIPLCYPKFLKGLEYVIDFRENNCAYIHVGELQIIIDYTNKKCANNKALKCYGSDDWGKDIQIGWCEIK